MSHELTLRLIGNHADKTIVAWLEEKARELFVKCPFNTGEDIRMVLGLKPKPVWCQHMDDSVRNNTTGTGWDYCPICGTKKPNEEPLA